MPDPAVGIKIRKISSPILAASRVPAVVGATNLFCVICCMITPEILIPTPARINAAVRGIRLIEISAMERSATPTSRDSRASTSKTSIRISVLTLINTDIVLVCSGTCDSCPFCTLLTFRIHVKDIDVPLFSYR